MNSVKKQSEYFAYGMALPNEEQYLLNENNQNKLEKINKNNSNKLDNTKFALKRKKLKNKKKIKQKSRKTIFNANDPMLGFGTNKSPWERSIKQNKLLNTLNDFNELKENEINKKKNNNIKEINNLNNKKCSRYNLTINIKELGLDDRIIAPKSFDAGYCSGLCEYPINKNLKPSNHAIFQSLIVRLESLTNINNTPQVCCAPDKLDSLTMLYFNDNGNLVLKNFPRMIILQCGCI